MRIPLREEKRIVREGRMGRKRERVIIVTIDTIVTIGILRGIGELGVIGII